MIISTDSTANLPIEYYERTGTKMIPLQICMDGEIYDDLSERLPLDDFYNKMRAGSVPKTAQINREAAREYFENLVNSGEDVIHISFSSSLSGNTSTIIKIAEEVNENHENKIYVIDCLNAAMGEGLQVIRANELKDQGKSVDEIVADINDYKTRVRSYFTINELKYLVNGGRVSKFSGIMGKLLNIKPMLKVDENGCLVPYKKVISRKKSISELAEVCIQNAKDLEHIFICHAVCLDEAKQVADLVESSLGVRPEIYDLTQVIGSHTGPGLLAIFFEQK